MTVLKWLKDDEKTLLSVDERRTLVALVEQGRKVHFEEIRGNGQEKYFARVADPTNPQHWYVEVCLASDAIEFDAMIEQAHRFVKHLEIKRAYLLSQLGDGE